MLYYPRLTPIEREKTVLSDFSGINKNNNAPVNSLFDAKNISSVSFPLLETRRGKKCVFNIPENEEITGIFCYDRFYITTNFEGRTKLYYGDDFSQVSEKFLSLEEEGVSSLFIRFNNNICLFNLKKTSGETNVVVASPTSLDFPSRYETAFFNDVTVFGNRVIGCRKKQIRACAELDISKWENQKDEEADLVNGPFLKNYEMKSEFTACTTFKNRAIFFNEDEMFEFSGRNNLQFTLTKIADVGCLNRHSLCEIDGRLYFLSKGGLMRYTGAFPERVSDKISLFPKKQNGKYSTALGGVNGKLYLKVTQDDQTAVYTFDTQSENFSKEDGDEVVCYASTSGKTFFADKKRVYELDCDSDDTESDADSFEWEMVSQQIHNDNYKTKGCVNIELCMHNSNASRVEVFASFDGGEFEMIGSCLFCGTKTICIPVLHRKMRNLQIKLRGRGEARIHYLCQTLSKKGDSKNQ